MHDKIIIHFKHKITALIRKIDNLQIFLIQVIFKKTTSPNAIYIEPTNICDANCIFCAYQFYGAKKGCLNIETLKKILNEAKEIGVKNINLTPFAGEILVDNNILGKINLIKEYKFDKVGTYTNLLNLHNIDTKKFLNSGLTELHISSAPLKKDLYEKIYRVNKYDIFLKNLIHLLKVFNNSNRKTIKNIYLEFRSPLTFHECINLPDYILHVKELITENINVSSMNVFDSWMGAIKETDLINGMNIAKPNGKKIIPCSRLNIVQILSNGDIRVCGCRFNNKSKKDVFYVGNISKVSIKNAYNSNTVYKIKKGFITHDPVIECQKCSWYS